jgi:hypothetical protein
MLPDEIRTQLQDIVEELASRGQRIIAQRSEISLSKALEQVRLLKEHSKVAQLSKKNRSNF